MNTENVGAVSNPPVVVSAGSGVTPLQIEMEVRGGVAILRCKGRLVYRKDPSELGTIVTDVLDLTRRLVIDLSKVEMVDSAGLGEIVMLHMWAKGLGHTMKFASPNSRVQQLLELTNLVTVLDVYPTVDEAVHASLCAGSFQ